MFNQLLSYLFVFTNQIYEYKFSDLTPRIQHSNYNKSFTPSNRVYNSIPKLYNRKMFKQTNKDVKI